MGYMGFGMQKWIYTRRPRKPFSKRSLQTSSTIDTYISKDMNVTGRTHKNDKLSKNELHNRIQDELKQSKRRSTIYIIMAFTLITLITILIFYIEPWNKLSKDELFLIEYQRNYDPDNQDLYDMSMSYGINYFTKGDYPSAISEFHQALKLFPKDKIALDFLLRSYVQNCLMYDRDCDKTKKLLEEAIISYPDSLNYQSYLISVNNK